MASSTAARLSASDDEAAQPPKASSTLPPTKAPIEMKAPWPKFITSIRPNTSVRPDAMMKISMPMASPASVSVAQVEKSAISARPAAASTTTVQ